MNKLRWMALGLAVGIGVMAVRPVVAQDMTTMLSKFLVDLRAGTLGVNMPLTGATFTTGPVTFGTTPATTGTVLRIPNNTNLVFARNAADSGNLALAFLDSNNLWNLDPSATGILYSAKTFAALGTPANGAFYYCSDCTIASPCAGAGTGAFAKRLAATWVCN